MGNQLAATDVGCRTATSLQEGCAVIFSCKEQSPSACHLQRATNCMARGTSFRSQSLLCQPISCLTQNGSQKHECAGTVQTTCYAWDLLSSPRSVATRAATLVRRGTKSYTPLWSSLLRNAWDVPKCLVGPGGTRDCTNPCNARVETHWHY